MNETELENYKPVPVEMAVQIANNYDKSKVIIVAYDPEFNQLHTTTYGKAPEDKEDAARAGERITKMICGERSSDGRWYEDYRTLGAGKNAEDARFARKVLENIATQLTTDEGDVEHTEEEFGLEISEIISMAHDNMITQARSALSAMSRQQ